MDKIYKNTKKSYLLVIALIFIVITISSITAKELFNRPTQLELVKTKIHSLPDMTVKNTRIEYKGKIYVMNLKDINNSDLEKKIGLSDDRQYNVYKIHNIDINQAIGVLFNKKNPTIYFKADISN